MQTEPLLQDRPRGWSHMQQSATTLHDMSRRATTVHGRGVAYEIQGGGLQGLSGVVRPDLSFSCRSTVTMIRPGFTDWNSLVSHRGLPPGRGLGVPAIRCGVRVEKKVAGWQVRLIALIGFHFALRRSAVVDSDIPTSPPPQVRPLYAYTNNALSSEY